MEQAQKEEAALWDTPMRTNAVSIHKGLSIFKFARFANEEMFDPPTGEAMCIPTQASADRFLSNYKPPEQRFRIPTIGGCCLSIMPTVACIKLVCKRHKKELFSLSHTDALDPKLALNFLNLCKHSSCDNITNIPQGQVYTSLDHID